MSVEANAKEKYDRLRAKRGGHRGVCTRLAKEAEQVVQSQDEENIDRSEVIHSLLSEKLKILNKLDEEILGLCEVKDIEREIEESSEIIARILNATKKIEKYKRGQANVNKVSNQTIVSQSCCCNYE